MSLSNNPRDGGPSRSRWAVYGTLLLVAIVALAGAAVPGSVVADGDSGSTAAELENGTALAAADGVDRTVADTEVAPGETTTVEVVVETEGELGDQELVRITDEFSAAFANVERNDSDPAPGGAGANPANDEFRAIWNEDADSYTVSYDVTVPLDAEPGDEFEVGGTLEVGGEEETLPSETIAVSGEVPEDTAVWLEPSDAEVASGDRTTFDVVVTGADDGVGAYSVNVSAVQTDVAEITDLELASQAETDGSEVAADGSWALVEADLGDEAHEAGDRTVLGQLTVEANGGGTTQLTIPDAAEVSDSSGQGYAVSSSTGATVTVPDGDDGDGDDGDNGGDSDADGGDSNDSDDSDGDDGNGDDGDGDDSDDGDGDDGDSDDGDGDDGDSDGDNGDGDDSDDGDGGNGDGDDGGDGLPGMGIGAALVSLVASGYLFVRRQDEA